jgi:uncharacterized protein
MILPTLYIAPAPPRGRGVFTVEDILSRTVIEVSPVIVMGAEDRKLLDQTILFDYIFEWDLKRKQCCMALGYVALYNHAYGSNCEYEMDYEKSIIRIKTVRFVRSGEELFINYNGDWNSDKPVWFKTE